ncbi:MAG: PQQ-binding-like beta-propeller repeat protein [Verrucomicrobia bacterium]|nr:PQQ-binding-like beta-propeller repeat protein [Verrucomicrobiota bacterium]MCH8511169.1 PQQ-binding-like beta-propeller repeat protein [Kiritimatiellia bacterium]
MENSICSSLPSLGVIPVLVNTGAALLPAAIAAVASAVALLFKPKELFRVCRAKPHVPLILLLVVTGGYFGFQWMMGAGGEAPPAVGRQAAIQTDGAGTQTDWTRVALQILRNEQRQAQGESRQPAAADAGDVAVGFAADDVPEAHLGFIFRRDAARRGHDGGPAPLNLSLDWEVHPEEFAMILTSPIENDGIVYGASTLLDPPSTYGMVFAVESASGDLLWEAQYLDNTGREMKGFFSSPALTADGRHLIIGQGLHPDTECELICIDTETGEVVWTVRTPIHIESSPAIYGDIVVVGAGAIEVGPERKPQGDPEGVGHPGYVFAVRISTGEELWQYQVNDPESSPAIKDGIAYIGSGFNGEAVVALRVEGTDEELAAQGLERLLWRTDTPYPAVAAVTLVDDLVLIGGGNSDFVFADPNPAGVILALDQSTGEVRWSLDMPDSVLGPIAVHNGVGVAPVRSAPRQGRRSGMLVAFDVRDKGRVLWEHHLERNALMLAGVALMDTHVYSLSSDGYLRVLDAADGTLVEEHYINRADRPGEMGLSISSPTVSNGRVFVGSETGGLRAYEGRAGE